MTSKFDENFSTAFQNIRTINPMYVHVEKDSVLHYVGDVKGKRILDLGCGDGIFCRRLKKKGAEIVIGIDISEAMIKMAKEEEDKEPVGIDYLVQDVRTMKKIGDFDIILGNLFLTFAENQTELETTLRVIYENLKSGGHFIGFSPDLTRMKWSEDIDKLFGFRIEKLSDIPNGNWIRIETIPSYPIRISFKLMFLHPEIYHEVFSKIGFLNFSFLPVYLSDESVNSFPEGFWSPYWKEPIFSVMKALK